MSPGQRWIAAVVALLVGNAVAAGVLVLAARGGGARIVAGYDAPPARDDQRRAEDAASAALGWTSDVAAPGGVLEVVLRDRAGAPVAGATLRATGAQRAFRGDALDLALVEATPGTYRAAAPVGHPGVLDLTVRGDLGPARFVRRVTVDASAPATAAATAAGPERARR